MTTLVPFLLLLGAWGGGDSDCYPQAPCFASDSVTNSASNKPGSLAPGTLATIYGTNLSFTGFSGVEVYVRGLMTSISYVSDSQVNFLIPMNLLPGEATLKLVRDGTAGPPVKIALHEFAPALFQCDAETAIGLRWPDYALATPEVPAQRGEYVMLWATGLGAMATRKPTDLPLAVQIARRKDFKLILDGKEVDDALITYVGAAPGFEGLYQINLLIPADVENSPEIRISLAGEISPPAIRLPIE